MFPPIKLWQRLVRAKREYGRTDFFLLCLQRAIGWLPGVRIERHHLVAQPVAAPKASHRGRHIVIRQLDRSADALRLITRIPEELDDRFDQGAICLAAFNGDELLGWIWLAFNRFRDFEEPFLFVLPENGEIAWDLDVFVKPEHRLGPVFPRLWAAATEELERRGARWTASTISGFNPASLAAHRRLGAHTLGVILVIRLGRLTGLASRQLGIPLTWAWQKVYRHRIEVNEPA